jgi:hypothetical protein
MEKQYSFKHQTEILFFFIIRVQELNKLIKMGHCMCVKYMY